jgi:hypothetical protein
VHAPISEFVSNAFSEPIMVLTTTSNSKLLMTTIVLAFVPPAMAVWIVPSETIIAIAGVLWLATAVLYCLRVRTRTALWIFALVPIAFGTFVYELLIIIGVLLSHGNF